MVSQNTVTVKPSAHKMRGGSTKSANTPSGLGYCLNCGARVSFCGKPFSAEIRCPKCGAVNVYENSQQPMRLAQV